MQKDIFDDNFLLSAVTVTLQQGEYEVDESDGMIQVCVELTAGVVERSVEILLNTADNTATGKLFT